MTKLIKLNQEFTKEEERIINIWNDEKLEVLDKIENICYLLNSFGDLTYEECFGKTQGEYFNNQKYFLAKPRRVIKYYNYYLLENKGEEGKWYIGEMQLNGNIEFFKCSETLSEAFDSL